ncbi:outer membrane lipid asymmetry maintenance protein MlaD [Cognatishimia sp. MH4019]|uniref:outer membrane lipid asymmetry maintenance protein MlaD n=1 Tax=Cognatishimia sp. MH4019 TaxID=2854030 RepID=UPI001CD8037C|nr:outer membrane lipid asymmetry maintenance protein MlaD [Cognatishimia sp. MH4019]
MSENKTEVIVGTAVLAAAIGFLVYAGQATGYSNDTGEYDLIASFRSVEGISVGTDVRMAGVTVGSVKALDLNAETFRADTTLAISDSIVVPDDTSVAIASEGLLGGNFVELVPGGSPFNLEPGDEIIDTQSSVSLISLLLKFVSGSGE